MTMGRRLEGSGTVVRSSVTLGEFEGKGQGLVPLVSM